MLVKKYLANDIQQAMDQVRKELGSDAVILNSRKVRKKGLKNLFRKPVLEVMVAYDPATIPAVKKLNLTESFENALKQKSGTVSNEQLERLDKRIDSIDNMLSDFIDKFSYVKREVTYDYPKEVQDLLQKMIDSQVREELAHSLAKEADQILRKEPGTSASEVLEHIIIEKIGRPEPILHKKFTQKVILVLGPTGAGKTTTIVKLAADFAIKQKKKVGLINTDTYRVGTQEVMQTYADILGVPLQKVFGTEKLENALEEMADRDLIFIDTAGKRPGDEEHRKEILDLVRAVKPEEIFLCLSATTGFAATKEIIDTYGFVDDYKLLVTKVDETRFRGPLLNMSWYTQKPLSYITTGQSVPEDIEILDVETVAKTMLGINTGSANTALATTSTSATAVKTTTHATPKTGNTTDSE